MKKLILVCFALFTFSSSLLAQSWLWGKAGYGSLKSNTIGGWVSTDKKGNAYMSGSFDNAVDFPPFSLVASSDNSFLVRYNSAGKVSWAIVPVTSDNYGTPNAVDTAGNVYITGTGGVSGAFFLMKLDTNGNTIWNIALTNGDGHGVATDKRGYTYVIGGFRGSVTLGSYTVLDTGAAAGSQIFFAKVDGSGHVIWVRQSTGDSTIIISRCLIRADNEGNVYVACTFNYGIYFGANYFFSPYPRNGVILAKYDSSGNLKWVVNPKVPYSCSSATVRGITTDNANNVYLNGFFSDSITFGAHVLANNRGNWTMYLAKFDAVNGNNIWAEQSMNNSESSDLTSDRNNNIYVGCWSQGNLTFGGMTFNTPQPSSGIIKLDTSGKAICGSLMKIVAGSAGIACDSMGRYFYLAGETTDTAYAGPDTLVPTHGGDIPFIARWQSCGSQNNEGINNLKSNGEGVVLYPNPNNGQFTIKSSGLSAKSSVEVYNMLGEKIYSRQWTANNGQCTIDLSNNANGIYLYRVVNESGNLTGEGKFVIQR
ncbi:MAG TPA: T9SS type A sorting domain-containing protein [Bacteroidia bacterium]|jgi:hypothetical protein|nr:T9SS type A sorting domain-containing protein [Bacteroidia bacterium]